MAANGQRIHPAGSRKLHPRHAATVAGTPLDPNREHDACGVGFVAAASGARTHEVVEMALEAVARVAHRGAASTDHSGDGAGLLTQIPVRLFHRDAYRLGLHLEPGLPFGVGAFFLPRAADALAASISLVEQVLVHDGIPFLGWREVPTNPNALGPTAEASCPVIRQALVGRPAGTEDEDAWERSLYLARREMEHRVANAGLSGFYVCSLSCRTIVYKALLTGTQLPAFFTDFRYPEYESAIAVFHQRYSTNTLPSWPLAQPFRLLAHNGEINTLWGNRNAMTMRQPMLTSPVWGANVERVRDVVWAEGSDSASLDNTMELLVRSGREPVHAAMMMVPQAWEKYSDLDPAVKAFYEYHQCVLEPWDGPAALALTDGIVAAAAVDRNGLRPCRYKVRRDGLVAAGSEVGLVDLDPREVVACGRVGAGEVLVVDTLRGEVIRNQDAKRRVAARRPYARWVARYMATLAPDPSRVPPTHTGESLLRLQRAFGYGSEDVRLVLEPMGTGAGDPVWSMGDDTPIPPLSAVPQSLYAYFRQRFAQVTNPPIDSLRESMVMSLRMHLGRRGSPLLERPTYARMLRLEHPVLLAEEMSALRNVAGFSTVTLDAVWDSGKGAGGLKPALTALRRAAERAARRGAHILIISDRAVGEQRAPIPMLLAVGAVRQHLVHTGLRARVGLIAEVGDAFDIHHFATLFGYGAEAVHPWLALESVGGEAAPLNYRSAAEKGLLKILSKMGISTLSSYCGAQIFEALGLGHEVIEACFDGTASPIGGIGFEEIAEDVEARHQSAYRHQAAPVSLPDYGRARFRKDGEDHGWAPPIVVALQQATGAKAERTERTERTEGNADMYQNFLGKNTARRPAGPRDLLGFRQGDPIPLGEVEPAEEIRRRFVSSAMSLGALSPEAHATLSIAMNRIGARSNSGEGGEDPESYHGLSNGDRRDNRVKQVASARFGVTTEYLTRAEELEIKIVQGAKPGEGGQLPAHKVTDLIARLRHAVPGIQLISPPPHHDIYSIEDLAQLIHDLKTVNPRARVGVKLVSESGVGTVAAGVAKAYADYVLIAGHNGGTGASPLSSIKHAGSPWELGLAEAQATLVRNGLRHRIEVRTDGGLRTGRDVVIAALLGAESYGFGTAPLVAMGCAMARQCHVNTCPTGIATQREDLRAKFRGTPEQVITYFTFLAEEVRRILAQLGFRSVDDIVGRNDLLERLERPDVPRAQMLDLSMLMAGTWGSGEAGKQGTGDVAQSVVRRRTVERNDRPGLVSLDEEILGDLEPYLECSLPFSGNYQIRNHHLAVGARVSGAIVARHTDAGLPPRSVRLRFTGTAGQSFGAFACRGVHLELEGEANDYVGKGLSGGEITIRAFRRAGYAHASHQHLIVGNTVLYGATGGKLYAAGQAGDRFAVRNSGAVAVIEGAGNHCCEYMTGGIVAVLGRAGRNFGAGMSNGVAYVMDEAGSFPSRVNPDMVELDDLDAADFELLRQLIREHEEKTVSPRARNILVQWDDYLPLFRKVVPKGAAELVGVAREQYLRASPGETELALERRTA